MASAITEQQETLIDCQTAQGQELRGTPLRLTRYGAVFEVYSPGTILRISEVLDNFRITSQGRVIYLGTALVSSLVNTGTILICEVKLEEKSLQLAALAPTSSEDSTLRAQFQGLLAQWQRFQFVRPEFKQVVSDMQTFLSDLRLWTDQLELEIRSRPFGESLHAERRILEELAPEIIGALDSFVEPMEQIASELEEDLRPVHRAYLRRQLHPLLLCSPFAYRSYQKPLGYAGDYEMVNMMLRPPQEGSTLFSKLVNTWLLDQRPVHAHRRRIEYLVGRLRQEGERAGRRGRVGRVYSLGCGPAAEIPRFLEEAHPSEALQFVLVDFNDETLFHTEKLIESIQERRALSTPVQLLKRSVQQIIKDSSRVLAASAEEKYDFIYCAGLFDYLSDPVCRRLLTIYYQMLSPGGCLLVTNASDALNDSRPFRYSMDFILDWHLVYRDGTQLRKLAPENAPAEAVTVTSEENGVNLFLEVTKPDHA